MGGPYLSSGLIRCPRWSNIRHELERLDASRWGDLAYMLGADQTKGKTAL